MVMRSIAGRETQPAESVFKNIKILKGIPAGRLVSIMNLGFGRSLGVSCGFCHVPGKWDLDDKEEKNTARLMFAMVQTINRDYISKVPSDSGAPQMQLKTTRWRLVFSCSYLRSLAVGYGTAGYGPILATVYSLAQKSGGPSLSCTLWLTGFSPSLRYAAIA